MDSNLFEYLIIIFFIVSALQSFFGKKKKKQTEQRNRDETARTQSTQSQQKVEKKKETTQDILEQLFGLKIPDQTGSQTKYPSDRNTEVLDPSGYHDTTWNPEEEFEDSVGVETVRYEQKKVDQEKVESEFIDPNARLEARIKKAKESLKRLPDKIEVEDVGQSMTETVEYVKNIRKNISNPDTIREYILVSEILNKPKAYRR
ncbi:MAG: hypothetical protein C4543_00470 [Ignavibacteriales bacterium]|jgi:hypothetical protein|nr:hypothetical protein [Melioribacteraceae bacterium]RJP63410.1 MAG: hypothetical protein C4543_00470 [Ignavibacteriales bacterium]